MRTTCLLAFFGAALTITAAQADNLLPEIALSPKDPKYNSAECRSMRQQAQNFSGVMQQSAGSYVIAAVAPGGTVGFLALQQRKREMFKAKVEQACMTNPPDRSYLDRPNGR